MAKKQKPLPPRLQAWVDARNRHKLTHARVKMARELGLNPKKFGGMDNHRQEPWKTPLDLRDQRNRAIPVPNEARVGKGRNATVRGRMTYV